MSLELFGSASQQPLDIDRDSSDMVWLSVVCILQESGGVRLSLIKSVTNSIDHSEQELPAYSNHLCSRVRGSR
jgi:hypothetical protein